MNTRTILGAVIGFIVVASIMGLYVYSQLANASDIYMGKIIFKDDASYTKFKETLLDQDIKVNTLNSLSSDEHFIDFNISVPHSYDFPYGKSTSHDKDLEVACLVSFLSGLFGAAFGSALASWKLLGN